MSRERKHAVNRGVRLLIAFICGQAVQLVCHAVALNLWEYRQIPFCLAAGFLVATAVFAGMRIATRESVIRYEDMQ